MDIYLSFRQLAEEMRTPLTEKVRLSNCQHRHRGWNGRAHLNSFSRSHPVISAKLSRWGSSGLCWKTPTRKSSTTPGSRLLRFPLSSFWILVSCPPPALVMLQSILIYMSNVTDGLWDVINSKCPLQTAVKHKTLLWTDVTFEFPVDF